MSNMYGGTNKSTQCTKYLAQLNALCNSIAALVTVLRSTEVRNVDAVIKYNSELITKLQEIQRALLYFKNSPPTPSTPPGLPSPPDDEL
jgi:hypothetical protein